MTRRPVPRALRLAARAADHEVEHDTEADAAAGVDAGAEAGAADDAGAEVAPVRRRPSPRPKRAVPVTEAAAVEADGGEAGAVVKPSPRPRRTAGEPAAPVPDPSIDIEDEPVLRRRVSVSTAALAVLVVLAVGAAGWLFWLDHRATATERARRDGLAAAISGAQTILSYDHRRIDADIAAASRLSTGQFRTDYADTSRTLAPVAKQYKAVVKATVKASSVVRAEPARVVTLLFVDQATQSTRVQGTKVDLARVRVTVVKGGDGWRVAKVEAL